MNPQVINSQLSNYPKKKSDIARAMNSTNPALTLALANANRQRKKQKKQKKRVKMNPMRVTPAFKNVEVCSIQYASILADPMRSPVGGCVPFGFPVPTLKTKVFTRGTFNLGTTGIGYIIARPTFANNVTAITASSGTTVMTEATTLSAATNLNTFTLSQLPYTSSQITGPPILATRVVGAGLYWRYKGSESGRNGRVVPLEEPDHNDLSAMTSAQILQYLNTKAERPPPDGEWHCVKWSGPVDATEAQLTPQSTAYVEYSLGGVISGTAADSYEFEFYEHVEYGGVTIGTTPSHADANGYSKAVEAFKAITSSGPLDDKNATSGFMDFLSAMGTTGRHLLLTHGAPMLAGLISPALPPLARAGVKMIGY